MGAVGPLAGRMAGRHGWRAVALASLLIAASGITISLVASLPVVVLGLALVTLGYFTAVTAAQLGVAGATDRDRGLASDVLQRVLRRRRAGRIRARLGVAELALDRRLGARDRRLRGRSDRAARVGCRPPPMTARSAPRPARSAAAGAAKRTLVTTPSVPCCQRANPGRALARVVDHAVGDAEVDELAARPVDLVAEPVAALAGDGHAIDTPVAVQRGALRQAVGQRRRRGTVGVGRRPEDGGDFGVRGVGRVVRGTAGAEQHDRVGQAHDERTGGEEAAPASR
jgi:hypothetical protein